MEARQNTKLANSVFYLLRLGEQRRIRWTHRKVILVSIGSASAIGSAAVNRKLSVERSEAPLPAIGQYLVNIPHQFYKVSAIGDMYAPKKASMQVEKRYQSARIIAAYGAAQLASQ
jgi:hypothetical protein